MASVSVPAHRLMYLPLNPWTGTMSGQGDLCGKAHTVTLTVSVHGTHQHGRDEVVQGCMAV